MDEQIVRFIGRRESKEDEGRWNEDDEWEEKKNNEENDLKKKKICDADWDEKNN